MRRRSVLVGGALTLLIAPKPSVSQQPQAKIPRVGVLTQASSNRAPMFDAFREGLRDLGYVEGSNIIIEFRFAGGDLSRGAELAAELGSIPVDVIVNEGVLGSTASSAMDSNGRIPIVSPVMVDPVGFGLAASLARPGGNVTGFTLMTTELNGKRVELLHDAFRLSPRSPSSSTLQTRQINRLSSRLKRPPGRWVWGMSAGSRPRA